MLDAFFLMWNFPKFMYLVEQNWLNGTDMLKPHEIVFNDNHNRCPKLFDSEFQHDYIINHIFSHCEHHVQQTHWSSNNDKIYQFLGCFFLNLKRIHRYFSEHMAWKTSLEFRATSSINLTRQSNTQHADHLNIS